MDVCTPQNGSEDWAEVDSCSGLAAGPHVIQFTPAYLAVMSEVTSFLAEVVEQSAEAEEPWQFRSLVKRIIRRLRYGISRPLSYPDGEQLRRAYDLAIATARQLELSEVQARCLADTIVGAPQAERENHRPHLV